MTSRSRPALHAAVPLVLLAALLAACGASKGSTAGGDRDAGGRADAVTPPPGDSGTPPEDGGGPADDSAAPPPPDDSGTPPPPPPPPPPPDDSGTPPPPPPPPTDSGPPPPPPPPTDAGPPPPRDAGSGGGFVVPPGPLHSVAIGESWTDGQGDEVVPPGWPPVVGTHIAAVRPGSRMENFACSGWSAPQLLSEGCAGRPPIERVEAASPDIVFILIGANDITDWQYEEPSRLGDYDPVRYETALREVHARIAAAGARVVQLEVPNITRFPVAASWTAAKRATILSRITEANVLIRAIVAERGGIVVPIFGLEPLYASSNFIGDGLHMQHAGYAIVGEAVWDAISSSIR